MYPAFGSPFAAKKKSNDYFMYFKRSFFNYLKSRAIRFITLNAKHAKHLMLPPNTKEPSDPSRPQRFRFLFPSLCFSLAHFLPLVILSCPCLKLSPNFESSRPCASEEAFSRCLTLCALFGFTLAQQNKKREGISLPFHFGHHLTSLRKWCYQ